MQNLILTTTRATCVIPLDTETNLSVVYNPVRALVWMKDAVARKAIYVPSFVDHGASFLIAWDLIDQDDTVVPITPQSLAEIPTRNLEAIIITLCNDVKRLARIETSALFLPSPNAAAFA